MTADDDRVGTVVETLGFEALREGQEETVTAVLSGRDTLAVMPTGAGKSAIYQIAGELMPGPTVVISPLIALQQDQVQALAATALGDAAQSNSWVSAAGRREAFRNLARGDLEYLFLAPEQFAERETLERVVAARPSLVVVDEAHCVSGWGHDFRPDYLRLGAVVEALGHPPVLALTATASPPVRREIVADLAMVDPVVVVRGFDRPNIHLAVERFRTDTEKLQAFVDRVAAADPPGIAYAATRRRTEEAAAALAERGVAAAPYHAGLPAGTRRQTQQAFMDDALDVVVATTAFGMGIDKPNVRFVFHLDVADSVDSYYQEIGRAGRDEEPARAVLFYRPEDLGLRRFFAARRGVDEGTLRHLVATVAAGDAPVAQAQLEDRSGLSESRLVTALNRLEKAGAVRVTATGEVSLADGADGDAAAAAAAAQEAHRRIEQSRVEMIRAYAETRDCRRQFILNYFGEPFDDPCPNCDNCDSGRSIAEDAAVQPFPLNSRVRHPTWGGGLLVRYEGGDKTVVLFDDVGYKTLSVPMVIDGDLLRPEPG